MSSRQHSAAARLKKPAKRRNRRTRRVWVSRDCDYVANYNITSEEPPSIYCGRWEIPETGYASCNLFPEDIEWLLGIKLKPGELKEFDVLLTLTPVKKGGKP